MFKEQSVISVRNFITVGVQEKRTVLEKSRFYRVRESKRRKAHFSMFKKEIKYNLRDSYLVLEINVLFNAFSQCLCTIVKK